MTSSQTQMHWDEVKWICQEFCIFVGNPELRWFEYVWNHMSKLGKCSYADENGRHQILIRLITLGIIFQEFAFRAWEERSDPETVISEIEHEEELLNPVRVGAMAGSDALQELGENEHLFYYAVLELVERELPEVRSSLLNIFHSDAELFVSLWYSIEDEVLIGQYSEEKFDEALNIDIDPCKLEAYQFISEGFQPFFLCN